jgi:hypothetical protein
MRYRFAILTSHVRMAPCVTFNAMAIVTMHRLNINRLATLMALILMLLIAGAYGYRLNISVSGLTFERSQP